MRVISFRHEQNAGYAASIAGFLTQKPGICLTVSAPGFLQRPHRARARDDQLLPDDPHQRLLEREIVDLQQGDYEEMDQLAIAKPLCKAAFRVLHAEDIGVGVARAIRAALSGRPGGVYLDLPAKLFPQSMDAEAGRKSLIKVVDPAPRQIPAPDAVQRALDLLKGAKKPLIILGQGCCVRAMRRRHPRARREDRHSVPADVDGQGPAARHARAVGVRRALVRPAGSGRRDAHRRTPQLAPVAGQGQDVGRRDVEVVGRPALHPGRHLAAGSRQQRAHRGAGRRRHRARACKALLAGIDASWPKPPAGVDRRITERKDKNVAKMAETLAKNPSPMSFQSALNVVRDIVKANPDAMLVNEGANALDFTRSIVDMYKPRKRIDVGTWGIMGIGMGYCVAAAVVTGPAGDRGRRRQRIRLLRHGDRDDLPLQPAGVHRHHEQQRRLPRRREESDGGADPSPLVFVKDARYEMLMEAFGGVGAHVTTPDALRKAMEEAIRSKRPTLINAVIDEGGGTESGRITSLNPTAKKK
jgi:oxalyl-CoA decarboxylase